MRTSVGLALLDMEDSSESHKLSTERMLLLPLCGADVPALHDLWTNKEVRRYLWDNRIISAETVADIVSNSEAFFQGTGSGFFSIRLQGATDEIVGFCGHRSFEDGEEIELLYGLHPDCWSQGLGTEAARTVLGHGFETCGFDRVIAATDTPNQRSVKVMQRLGMYFDRRCKHHGLDTVFYSITAANFRARGTT